MRSLLAVITFLGCHFVNAQTTPIYQNNMEAGHTTPSQTPASQFYGGFVINDATNYPASHGSLFGYTNSNNGYGYSYQIFKGHTTPQLNIRFADYSTTNWFGWKKIFDSGNDIAYEGNVVESSIRGYAHIYGRASDGILHLHGATPTGQVFINYYEAGNIILAKGGGKVGIGTNSPATTLHVFGGRLTQEGTIVNDNNASFVNYDATGYGLYSKGGLNTHYAFHFENQAGTSILYGRGDGNIGIGSLNPDAKLTVKGTVHAQEVKVDLAVPGPDYVFASDYKLLPLQELKAYIEKNTHLPEVPSAREMETNGLNMSEMNMLLLKKIEELTLYLIEKDKEIQALKSDIEALKKGK